MVCVIPDGKSDGFKSSRAANGMGRTGLVLAFVALLDGFHSSLHCAWLCLLICQIFLLQNEYLE